MFARIRRASRLSPSEWVLFLQAWSWLLYFDLALRARPFSQLQAFAARRSPSRPRPPRETDSLPRSLTLAVDRARAHHLYPMTCLRRALTLQTMLARRGLPAELKIGVRKEDGQLSAHAWVEYEGMPLGEAEAITETFVTLQKQPS